jgi:hypothetical protein
VIAVGGVTLRRHVLSHRDLQGLVRSDSVPGAKMDSMSDQGYERDPKWSINCWSGANWLQKHEIPDDSNLLRA